ncbi:MAG: hypothetical protein E7295_02260 [Lachnospiraceae bacterium]|nr:hypothetical protein [Lachnospiraceae bacterium]
MTGFHGIRLRTALIGIRILLAGTFYNIIRNNNAIILSRRVRCALCHAFIMCP